jgi:hypothetical protein
VPKNYDQQPDVQLIPYYEFNPEIHNIEYRYFETPEYQNAVNQYYANIYSNQGQVSGDFRSGEDFRRPPYYGRPRPYYHPPFFPFFPPFYGGGYGYHPYGYHPYGYGGYGGYGGYHKDSSSR